jgi:hypothetical protein
MAILHDCPKTGTPVGQKHSRIARSSRASADDKRVIEDEREPAAGFRLGSVRAA